MLEVTDGEGSVGGRRSGVAPGEEESKYTKCAGYDRLQDAEQGEGFDYCHYFEVKPSHVFEESVLYCEKMTEDRR